MWQVIAEIAIAALPRVYDWIWPSPPNLAHELTQQPDTHEGSPVPLVFGTVRVRQPGLVWYSPITYDLGPLNGQPKYGANLLFAVGVPMGPIQSGTTCPTQLLRIWQGDSVFWVPPLGPLRHAECREIQQATLDTTQNDLFSAGFISFWGGASDQQLSVCRLQGTTSAFRTTAVDLMASHGPGGGGLDPTLIPGYRNQIMVALTGVSTAPPPTGWAHTGYNSLYLGGQAQIPAFSFEVQSLSFGPWAGDIGLDANPIQVLFDVLTAPWSKLGISPSAIDQTSFHNAANTIIAEGLGYSRVFDQVTDAKSIIQEIVNHINGALYLDPYTGLITLKLIRNDYDVTNLTQVPLFADAQIVGWNQMKPGVWVGLPSQVRVRYNRRGIFYQPATVAAQNMALAVLYDTANNVGAPAGKIRSATSEYPGCCEDDQAAALASRDLNFLSQPLARGQVVLDRSAHLLRPGGVFQVNYSEYGFVGMVLRAVKVDLNQLNDNRVIVDFVQDPFGGSAASLGGGIIIGTLRIGAPEPLATRKLTEAPYWLMLQAKNAGAIASADDQRILALAAPDDNSTQFLERTPPQFVIIGQSFPYSTDVPLTLYPNLARLYAPYGKLPEPYDTTNGILIYQLSANAAGYVQTFPQWTYTDNHVYGRGLVLLGDEIVAYESVTSLGNGIYRLNNIWRGELDTCARDHVAGELLYWLSPLARGANYVGTKSWQANLGGQLGGQAVPKGGGGTSIGFGSGEEATDTITVQLRGMLPARAADVGICGELIAGSQGSPAVNATAPQLGFYKAVAALEEGFGHTWKMRDHKATTVSRGDEPSEAPSDAQGTTIELYAQKVRSAFAPSVPANDAELAVKNGGGLSATNDKAGLLLGQAGYGDVDVRFHSQRILPPGTIGNVAQLTLREWDTPKVRVRAERWRSLLANVRFDFNGGGTSLGPWNIGSGTPKIYQDTNSISTLASDCYVSSSASETCVFSQTVDVSGYRPKNMFAVLRWYDRVITASTTTTIAVDLIALDGNNSQIGIASQSAVTPATANWTSRALTLALPSGTASVRVNVTLSSTAVKGPAASEFRLQIGTWQDSVLANPSFESALASWTTDAGGFVTGTSGRSPSATYAQGGAFTQSVMHQDYALPSAYTRGATAVLECWRMQQSGAGQDSGSVTLSVLDGGGNLLTSVTTGVENLTANTWTKRRLAIDLPTAGATPATIRVAFLANRLTFSSGNSGALLDETILQVHKDLSDARYYRALMFDTPSVQPVPGTWQEWHLAFPDLFAVGVADPYVFAGAQISSQTSPNYTSLQMVWADQQAHTNQLLQPCVGQWGGGVSYIKGYRFARQSGLTALDWRSYNEGTNRFGNPTSASSFSIGVLFRVDELPFSGGCGLTGRRDSNSGWGLDITAGGNVRATLQGTGGTITATGSTNVTDGAWHMAWIVYDANAQTLTVLDEASSQTASTLTLGEIANTAAACVFRIGRDVNTRDTIPGMIARVWVFAQALMPSQVARHWNLGKDPTGASIAYSRSGPAWFPGLPVTDGALGSAAGASDHTLVKLAASSVGHGYSDALAADGGTGWGLALTAGVTNNMPSIDFTNPAFWLPDAGTVLTQGIVDATGRPRGVTVAGDLNNGLRLLGLVNGAGVNCCVSFYARCLAGARVLDVVLLNASDVAKQTITVTLSAQWQRYDCQFTAWDNSTGTCHVLFKCDGPTAQVFAFDLTHIMFSGGTFEVPACWPEPGASLASDIVATLTETQQLAQFNMDGEVIATGVCPHQFPKGPFTIATVDNGSNAKNQRELITALLSKPEFDHYDSAGPTNVTSIGTALAWSQIWDLRGRWSPNLLDTSNSFAGLVVDVGSAPSSTYGRTSSWTFDETLDDRIRLGAGTNPSLNCYLRQLIIRTREEKLV